ncbi:unnamed protein product, partial [Brenthis ino]
MNLKLNNEVRSSVILLPTEPPTSVKEERQRTGRYIAILVGISLLMLALYHAWVRRIPVVASLVVPALIMFVYVGWVLYTASRDKKRPKKKNYIRIRPRQPISLGLANCSGDIIVQREDAQTQVHSLFLSLSYIGREFDSTTEKLSERAAADAEAALNAMAQENAENDGRTSQLSHNVDISIISSKESSKLNTPDESGPRDWSEISSVYLKGDSRPEEKAVCFIKPIILVNDKPHEDFDQKWTNIVETLNNNDRLKGYQTRRKFKRKFCRRRRHAAFKRSYSIG